jgi:hypothetical protein
MDYFKVVSTKETRGIYFTVVPHRWEVDGVVVAGAFATFIPEIVTVESNHCLGRKMDSISILPQMLRNNKF